MSPSSIGPAGGGVGRDLRQIDQDQPAPDLHRIARQAEARPVGHFRLQHRLGQLAVERVIPAVILAEQLVGAAALLLADAIAGMQAGIAHRMHAFGVLAHQHDRARPDIGAQEIAGRGEPAGMIDREPR